MVDEISKKETTIKLDETASLTDAVTPEKETQTISLTETIDLVDVISKKETTIKLDETASLTDADNSRERDTDHFINRDN